MERLQNREGNAGRRSRTHGHCNPIHSTFAGVAARYSVDIIYNHGIIRGKHNTIQVKNNKTKKLDDQATGVSSKITTKTSFKQNVKPNTSFHKYVVSIFRRKLIIPGHHIFQDSLQHLIMVL